MTGTILSELHEEAKSTKRLLERIPEESLAWQPHPKSLSLGQLSLHVARIPGGMSRLAQREVFDVLAVRGDYTVPTSKQAILAAFEDGISAATTYLTNLTAEEAATIWRMKAGEKEIMAVPRVGMLRVLLLNHWYHHRGQLTVYLRLLDVPLPIVYGRSADELPSF